MANVSFMAASKLVALVQEAERDGGRYVQLSESGLMLGDHPFKPRYIVDFGNEKLAPCGNFHSPIAPSLLKAGGAGNALGNEEMARTRRSRRSATLWIEIKGHRVDCGSLKEGLAEGLRRMEVLRPGMLEALSTVKPRSKRIVAKRPSELFEQSDLSETYAERLDGHWYYGTNNSAQETTAWLKRACSLAKLTWGIDFRVSW